MKKVLTLLPLLIVPLLTGCEEKRGITQLTFGTYMDKEAIQLSSSDFSTHFENEENFLLAIYPRDSSCSCWRHFSNVIDEAVENDHLVIYKYYAQDVASNSIMKEIGKFNDRLDAPTFYIINNKRITRYYNYTNTDFFRNKEVFIEEISNHIKTPKMFYVNEEQLDYLISEEERSTIFFARNKCGDCNYVIPKTLVPYFDNKTDVSDLYIFDLQPYRDEDDDIYQAIKDKYLLSETNNPDLGFGLGVVPTFQVYENGELIDMCIYVNDGELDYSSEDNCYYASNTYYQGDRLDLFHYLDDVEATDLSKVKIDEKDTVPYKNSHYWDITSSSKYYDPILLGFLNYYL